MAVTKSIEFIVEADVPALLFSSKQAAERYLEPIDIDNGTYPIAFDRTGLFYDVVSDENHGLLLPNINGYRDQQRLYKILVKFLKSVNQPVFPHDALDDLLRKCEPYLDE